MISRQYRAFCASLALFDEAGQLDLSATKNQIGRVADHGLVTCLPSGGTAEGNVLSLEEVRGLTAAAVEVCRGRVPVIGYGFEPRSADLYEAFVEICLAEGTDAVVLPSPDPGHGFHPNYHQLELYYEQLLKAARHLPVYLATHAGVGYTVPTELMIRLAQTHPTVAGFFVTHPSDAVYVADLRDGVGENLEIIVGGPARLLDGLADGATGWLGSLDMNVAPDLTQKLVDALNQGDWRSAAELYGRTHRLHEGFKRLGTVAGAKAALELLGLPGGDVRPPRTPVDDAGRAAIAELLKQSGVA